jgi:hypothetical protein
MGKLVSKTKRKGKRKEEEERRDYSTDQVLRLE